MNHIAVKYFPEVSDKDFYKNVLEVLNKKKIPFLIGGTYAVMKYTGIVRETKDLDIFCKAGDYPHIIKSFSDLGYKTQVNDERWLVKVVYKNYYVDFIFNSRTGILPVNNTWFNNAPSVKMFGIKARLIPLEEIIWSKSLRMGRKRFEGADINHLFLIKGKKLRWRHLLTLMEPFWEILFAHILMFRFVYPSERNIIPKWLMTKLITRLKQQLSIVPPQNRISRGSLLSLKQYNIDFNKWGFLDITQL